MKYIFTAPSEPTLGTHFGCRVVVGTHCLRREVPILTKDLLATRKERIAKVLYTTKIKILLCSFALFLLLKIKQKTCFIIAS